MTLKEIHIWLAREYKESLWISASNKFIRHKPGYRHKKTVFASEQNRVEIAQTQTAWKTWQKCLDLYKLMFLDET